MDFWGQVSSTFLGSLIGFIFSIALFYLTNNWNKNSTKNSLERNLAKEFEFNNMFLNRLLDDIKKVIEKVVVNDRDTTMFYFRHSSYQRMFLIAYFQQGLLYERLTPQQINLLDMSVSHLSQPTENYINQTLMKWQNGEIDQKEALKIFGLERDLIVGDINHLGTIYQVLFLQK